MAAAMTQDTEMARAVQEIQNAQMLVWVTIVLGPAWSIMAAGVGWTQLTWGVGIAVWCLLLFGAVHNAQSLRCPQCARSWRRPLSPLARRLRWPTQRGCSVCGFRLSDYHGLPKTIDRRGPKDR
jgi:hypothetical protein